MPRRDGTGPFGFGSLTGRGRGQCRGLFSEGGKFNTKRNGLLGPLVTFIGAVIWDAANPNGLLSQVSRKLFNFRKPDQIRNTVKADYIILDNNKPDKNKKKDITLKKQKD